MATFYTFGYLSVLTFLIFHFRILAADGSSSFSFEKFGKDPSFEANIALYGDANVVNGGSSVQLTNPVSLSAGRVMYKKTIRLVQGKPRSLASFSSFFSFSMSHDKGDGLAFVMVPSGFNFSLFDNSSFGLPVGLEKGQARVIAVEFDTLRDAEFGDLNENHVGIDVGSLESAKVRNLSSLNLVLNSGEKLQSWIDYEASSKRLEVRLSKFGDTKPVDPLLSYPIDLPKLWNDEEGFVGLSSSNRNSSQTCYVHSWSFKLRRAPHWMHSQPLDPKAFGKETEPLIVQKKSDCLLKMLAALILGVACGALGAFLVLYLWTIFGSRRPVVPEECAVKSVDSKFDKVNVAVDNAVEASKK